MYISVNTIRIICIVLLIVAVGITHMSKPISDDLRKFLNVLATIMVIVVVVLSFIYGFNPE